ncbi:LOW QUALITY PROTEIN: TBC1 domain family member 17-like [Morphnus guianensis]
MERKGRVRKGRGARRKRKRRVEDGGGGGGGSGGREGHWGDSDTRGDTGVVVTLRVLLEVTGVSIHTRLRPAPPRDGLLRGRLRVLQGAEDLVLQWEPLEGPWDPPDDTTAPPEEEEEEEELLDPGYEPDWAVLSPPERPRPPGWRGGFRLALGELRGLRRSPPRLRRPFLVLLPRRGACPPLCIFPRGGGPELLRLLAPPPPPGTPPGAPPSNFSPPPPGAPGTPAAAGDDPEDPALPPPHPPSPGIVTRLLQGPYAATVGGLSRLLGGPRGPAPGEEEAEPEPPFEVIACVTLGPRPTPPRGPPVTEEEWGRSHDAEGRSLDPEGLRERLFRGGLSPEVRLQGWRRLLGLRPWGGADPPERERERRDDYFRMKLQWRSLSAGQQRRNRPLRRYRQRLERDLARCHPDLTVPERLVLHDILMTYCMYHFDLGYVRGMSEVLAPLLAVTPDEVEAFWGFCSIMEMVGGNFGPGREGLKRQLGQLGQLLRVLDPNLCDRLEVGGTLGCCSRWLQLRFQPHFGLQGTLRLCEVLWTGLPCPNFQLVLSCVLLEMAGDVPGDVGDTEDEDEDEEEESDGDEAPPGRWPALEADEALSRAEGLFLQLAAAPDLPPALQELLGLGGPPPSPPPDTGVPPEPPHPERDPHPEGPPPPFQGGPPHPAP